MIVKLLVIVGVIYVVYNLYFKTKIDNTQDKGEEVDTMVKCSNCGVYVAKSDAIVKSGKYYCSKECL